MITKREAAIIAAYTGVMLGKFSDMHALVEEVLGRPVWNAEFASEAFAAHLREKMRPLFVALDVEGEA